jgi:transposase
MSQRFVGIDLHKRFCVFTELDSEGNLVNRGRFGNNIGEIADFASRLKPQTHLAVEPLLNYLSFLDQIEPYVKSVHPANPYKVRIIAEAKNKTDNYDSRMLAELLRTNFLPESYYVPRDIRILRDLVRQREHLVRSRAAFKNRARYLLFLNGSDIKAKDVSSTKAKKEIRGLCLPDTTRQSVNQCLKMIEELDKEITLLEKQLEENCEGVEDVNLLMSIPGIGSLRATIIYAEIGDINRFRSRKAFASYTGLVPTVRASGESTYMGRITKTGSKPLRYALVEAAITACRKSPTLHRMYYRILYRSNSQKARVAIAHKLALTIYAMLKKKEPFRD